MEEDTQLGLAEGSSGKGKKAASQSIEPTHINIQLLSRVSL